MERTMQGATTEASSSRPDVDGRARSDAIARLATATYAGRRLASFRRLLGTFLIATGTPIVVFSRSGDPTIRHVLTILALLFLSLVLPMVRLLFTEQQNRRLIDELRTRVSTS